MKIILKESQLSRLMNEGGFYDFIKNLFGGNTPFGSEKISTPQTNTQKPKDETPQNVPTQNVSTQKNIISNGFIITTPNNNSNEYALVYGGTPSSKFGAKFMMDKAKNISGFFESKNIIFSDWENSIEKAYAFLKTKNPKATIKSVSGFSKGGLRAFPAIGNFQFVGLIDPSIEGSYKSVVVAPSDNVIMIYKPKRNWGMNGLNYAISRLGKSRIESVNIGHSQMPEYFFQKYGDRL